MALNLSKNDSSSSEKSGDKKIKLNLDKKEITLSEDDASLKQDDLTVSKMSNKGFLYIVIGLLVFGAGIFFYQYNSNSEGVTSSTIPENDTTLASVNNSLPKEGESDTITGSVINSVEAAPLKNGEATKTESQAAVLNSINQLVKTNNTQVAYFDAGSDQGSNYAVQSIDVIIRFLNENTSNKITVLGFASRDGDPGKNQILSEKRAKTFKEYLVSKGANAAQINTRGEGSAKPIADDYTIEGRKKNRRVEFILE